MVNNELKNKKWYYFPSRRLAVALSLQGWRKAGATVFFTAGFTLLAHVPDPGESASSYPLPKENHISMVPGAFSPKDAPVAGWQDCVSSLAQI